MRRGVWQALGEYNQQQSLGVSSSRMCPSTIDVTLHQQTPHLALILSSSEGAAVNIASAEIRQRAVVPDAQTNEDKRQRKMILPHHHLSNNCCFRRLVENFADIFVWSHLHGVAGREYTDAWLFLTTLVI